MIKVQDALAAGKLGGPKTGARGAFNKARGAAFAVGRLTSAGKAKDKFAASVERASSPERRESPPKAR